MDKQKSLLFLMLIGVIAIFGSVVAYDLIFNHHFGNNKNRSNWEWPDDWNNQKIKTQPSEPKVDPQEPEIQPEQVVPQEQIVAKDYQDALKKSGELGMPILIIFETDWCSWCKKMKQETLPNSKVKELIKNYIMVQVNTDNNRDIAKKYGIRGLPSYGITNHREEKLKIGSGYKDADAFAKWLNNPNLYQQPKVE